MPILTLTDNEAEHLANLLEVAQHQLANNGCNDYPVANTDENWALYERVAATSAGQWVCDWRRSPDAETRDPDPSKPIYFVDWMLLAYFRRLLKGE